MPWVFDGNSSDTYAYDYQANNWNRSLSMIFNLSMHKAAYAYR